jgi:hypothetical protein
MLNEITCIAILPIGVLHADDGQPNIYTYLHHKYTSDAMMKLENVCFKQFGKYISAIADNREQCQWLMERISKFMPKVLGQREKRAVPPFTIRSSGERVELQRTAWETLTKLTSTVTVDHVDFSWLLGALYYRSAYNVVDRFDDKHGFWNRKSWLHCCNIGSRISYFTGDTPLHRNDYLFEQSLHHWVFNAMGYSFAAPKFVNQVIKTLKELKV